MSSIAGETRRLRILHVCPRPSFSGLEAYALAVAIGQRDLGHDVAMIVLKSSPLAEKSRAAQLTVCEVNPGMLALIHMASREMRKANRPDIVHLHSTQDLDAMLIPIAVSKLAPRPHPRIILQTHIWISHSKRDPMHAISYSFVDEVWCSSQPARDTLREFLPIDPEKIRVINYGRDVRLMEAGFLSREDARRALSLPSTATVVGTVARIDEGKGTRELLEASLRVMQDHPELHLILIGPPTADDPKAIVYAEAIRARIESLSPDSRVRVHALGALSDSYKYLKAFDLFALATYKECFALSLLEALLAGIPCLAANSGGSPEVVRPSETGWLFEPRSIDSLEMVLRAALKERSQWSTLGGAGRERVRRDFDFARLLPATIEAYRQLV